MTLTERAPRVAAVVCAVSLLLAAGCGDATRARQGAARPIPAAIASIPAASSSIPTASASIPTASSSIATASCVAEPLAPAPFAGEVGVYRAGPLILALGDDLAQHPGEWAGRRTSGSEAIAVLSGRQPVVLSVDPASRGRYSLQFTPFGRGHPSPVLSDGRAAVRFPACSGGLHRFGGGVLFTGRGCARLHARQAGGPAIAMLIPIGDTLRGCPASGPAQTLAPTATPFLGVSCPVPNSIVCDRVGIGVHLRRAATLVTVQIAGRLVTLSPPLDPPDDLWLGYLFDAGLRNGPLKVPIPANERLWSGSPEVYARVRVTAFFGDRHAATRRDTVLLHPGFG